jgi:hypothetical protein
MTTTDHLQVLREFRAEIPPPDEATRCRIYAFATSEPSNRWKRSVRPRVPLRPRFALPAVAVICAAVAATVLALLPAGESGGPSTAAAAVLLQAARTAAGQPATAPPGPNQFIYTKIKASWAGITEGLTKVHHKGSKRPRFVGPSHLVAIQFRPITREDWIRPDGSGRSREVGGHLQFLRESDRAYAYKHYSRKYIDGYTDIWKHGPGRPNYNELSKLPTDPAQLKPLIENRSVEAGPPGNFETFQIIGDLLRDTDAPPALRSALYTIASQLSGVRLIGPTRDQLGRPGTGVAYDFGGQRNELIFDPRTSGLLAEQTSVTRRSQDYPFRPGTLISWTAYLASGVVNSDTATTSATP